MPSGLADAGLVLAGAALRVATVGQAVGDVAGLPLPVGRALAVHRAAAAAGGLHAALAAARAVVGTRVHPVGRKSKKKRKNSS